MHFDDSVDSILEDGELRQMLASPLYIHGREGDFDSSRKLRASGEPDAVFSCHSESGQNTFLARDRSNESGNRSESGVHSVFRFADPAKVGKSLLDGNKDHVLNQARSELMKQERQV